MRILLIITDYGSFNNFLSEIAVMLVQNGHEVHLLCSPSKVINYEDKHPYREMGIRIEYVDFPRSFNPFAQIASSIKIHKKINAINPNLIHVHFTTGIFTTLLWHKPAYFTIGTIHGVGYPMMKNKIKRAIFETIEKFCFRRLDQIYLINEYDYALVNQLHPQKTFKHNGYGLGNDIHKFNPQTVTEHDRVHLRDELMIKDDDFVLAFTGRFVAFKGFDKVVRTFNALITHYKVHNIKLLIIGGEDPVHPNGLNKVENTEYKNSEQIINIPFTANVNKYLAVADVFVFPSIKEGMPVCVMEALSMGVPVITSNSRGCNDLVKHGFNGLLLSENPTTSEIREAVLKLYRDRALLHRLSQNALSKRMDYNREKYVCDQVDVYNNMAGIVNRNLALS